MNRRTFVTYAGYGMGAVTFTGLGWPFIKNSGTGSQSPHAKKLLATTDYNVNVSRIKSYFNRSHLDSLHKYLASIGVTRHQWIFDTIWGFYDNPDHFDLLAEAVDSAHRHGLEFYAEIKPFEGGGFGDVLPLSLPFPDEPVACKDMRGIWIRARPFVAANPHMSLKRRPGSYEVTGPVSAIRLVKGDDAPTFLGKEHLTIWTSDRNNGFTPYNGPVSFRESVEWRPSPNFQSGGRQCRILHLEGLQIPVNHKYILIRKTLKDKQNNLTNERGNIVELEGPHGENIPFILSTGHVENNDIRDKYILQLKRYKNRIRYIELPEVQAELSDENKWQKHYYDFYLFNENLKITDLYSLDKEGYIGIACGKPEYMLGVLNPVYPEVRNHWLDMTRFCLDRGVDGINFRQTHHTRMSEYWDYGFNEPVLDATGGKTGYPSINRVNGNAYTQFLREARDLIKSRGKSITVHLHTEMLVPDDRLSAGQPNRIIRLPPNFEWQWETWVREIADDLELRGTNSVRPWNLRQVMDTFSAVTTSANKPFYYQGTVGDGKRPYEFTAHEIDIINNYPGIKGYVLYETANFTKMNMEGEIEGSPHIKKIVGAMF